ncbi:hypothetical protein L3Y34_010169 [Caenorhabditis briggsae]|uniref:Uncharacterized protein n=1 Tax=Caenorhabditis briggsae TaxID=6238 RepID=A0AAE8ZP84_CAEBR|nr:hypothetical protein L3Y34_010169 [Caenorhabditis briggsae]
MPAKKKDPPDGRNVPPSANTMNFVNPVYQNQWPTQAQMQQAQMAAVAGHLAGLENPRVPPGLVRENGGQRHDHHQNQLQHQQHIQQLQQIHQQQQLQQLEQHRHHHLQQKNYRDQQLQQEHQQQLHQQQQRQQNQPNQQTPLQQLQHQLDRKVQNNQSIGSSSGLGDTIINKMARVRTQNLQSTPPTNASRRHNEPTDPRLNAIPIGRKETAPPWTGNNVSRRGPRKTSHRALENEEQAHVGQTDAPTDHTLEIPAEILNQTRFQQQQANQLPQNIGIHPPGFGSAARTHPLSALRHHMPAVTQAYTITVNQNETILNTKNANVQVTRNAQTPSIVKIEEMEIKQEVDHELDQAEFLLNTLAIYQQAVTAAQPADGNPRVPVTPETPILSDQLRARIQSQEYAELSFSDLLATASNQLAIDPSTSATLSNDHQPSEPTTPSKRVEGGGLPPPTVRRPRKTAHREEEMGIQSGNQKKEENPTSLPALGTHIKVTRGRKPKLGREKPVKDPNNPQRKRGRPSKADIMLKKIKKEEPGWKETTINRSTHNANAYEPPLVNNPLPSTCVPPVAPSPTRAAVNVPKSVRSLPDSKSDHGVLLPVPPVELSIEQQREEWDRRLLENALIDAGLPNVWDVSNATLSAEQNVKRAEVIRTHRKQLAKSKSDLKNKINSEHNRFAKCLESSGKCDATLWHAKMMALENQMIKEDDEKRRAKFMEGLHYRRDYNSTKKIAKQEVNKWTDDMIVDVAPTSQTRPEIKTTKTYTANISNVANPRSQDVTKVSQFKRPLLPTVSRYADWTDRQWNQLNSIWKFTAFAPIDMTKTNAEGRLQDEFWSTYEPVTTKMDEVERIGKCFSKKFDTITLTFYPQQVFYGEFELDVTHATSLTFILDATQPGFELRIASDRCEKFDIAVVKNFTFAHLPVGFQMSPTAKNKFPPCLILDVSDIHEKIKELSPKFNKFRRSLLQQECSTQKCHPDKLFFVLHSNPSFPKSQCTIKVHVNSSVKLFEVSAMAGFEILETYMQLAFALHPKMINLNIRFLFLMKEDFFDYVTHLRLIWIFLASEHGIGRWLAKCREDLVTACESNFVELDFRTGNAYCLYPPTHCSRSLLRESNGCLDESSACGEAFPIQFRDYGQEELDEIKLQNDNAAQGKEWKGSSVTSDFKKTPGSKRAPTPSTEGTSDPKKIKIFKLRKDWKDAIAFPRTDSAVQDSHSDGADDSQPSTCSKETAPAIKSASQNGVHEYQPQSSYYDPNVSTTGYDGSLPSSSSSGENKRYYDFDNCPVDMMRLSPSDKLLASCQRSQKDDGVFKRPYLKLPTPLTNRTPSTSNGNTPTVIPLPPSSASNRP